MLEATAPIRTVSGRLADAREWEQFPFTAEDFSRIRALIHRLAGISLSPAKKDLVYSRLARRLRTRQLNSFNEYLRLLENGDAVELETFVNALTTNMTSFFREAHHFPLLAEHIGGLAPRRPVSIWTCASSTGEEPYSIAMTLVEHYNSFAPPARILATDIDTSVLERARRGVYPLDQLQKLSPERLRRFFLKGNGENDGFAKVKSELRRMITFRQLNLLGDDWGIAERFDAIFCRNVMIYFDKETQYAILKRLARHLQPDGLLFAGHSESFHHAADIFRPCGKTVYSARMT